MSNKGFVKFGIGTRAIRGTVNVDFRNVRSHIPPLFQTVNFDYADTEEGLDIFSGEQEGYIYSRYGNPTTDLFAHVVADLEEAEAGVASASGMAAISNTMLTLVKPGDRIVSSNTIYGGTSKLFKEYLSKFGVETDFVDITNLDAVKNAVSDKSKILFTEVLGNPNLAVADLRSLSEIAHEHGLHFIVDSTFTPPPIIQPLKFGADLVIHSATKYIGGHGDIIGGVTVGRAEMIEKIVESVKMYGGAMSPFNAWLALRGIKTLAVRVERHCENALTIANFLREHPKVENVFYPGIKNHRGYEIAQKQLHGFGGMLSFEVKGGLETGMKVMDSVQVCNFTVSLGEIDTLIMHPASTSHKSLTPEERQAIGVSDGLIRLSVGLEDIDDLIGDLHRALEKV